MKRSAGSFSSGIVFPPLTFVLLVTMGAQTPQTTPAVSSPLGSAYPEPTNLQVLPRELTGQQVHELMEKWKTGLGMDCAACHAEDKQKVDADGRPLLNFASDAKAQKAVARLMYTMTEEINAKYIARIDTSGLPVTCGTCHRGHLGPVPFSDSQVQTPSEPVRSDSPSDSSPKQQ